MRTRGRVKPTRHRKHSRVTAKQHINIWVVGVATLFAIGIGWSLYQAHATPDARASQSASPTNPPYYLTWNYLHGQMPPDEYYSPGSNSDTRCTSMPEVNLSSDYTDPYNSISTTGDGIPKVGNFKVDSYAMPSATGVKLQTSIYSWDNNFAGCSSELKDNWSISPAGAAEIVPLSSAKVTSNNVMFHSTGSGNSSVGGSSSGYITYKRSVKQEAVVVVPKGQGDFTVTVELTTVRNWGAASSFASVKFSTHPSPAFVPPVFTSVKVEAEPATLVSALLDMTGHQKGVTLKATPIDQYGHVVPDPCTATGDRCKFRYTWTIPMTDNAAGRASFEPPWFGHPPVTTVWSWVGTYAQNLNTQKVYLLATPSAVHTLPITVVATRPASSQAGTPAITKTGTMSLAVSPTVSPSPPPPANPPATPPTAPPAAQRLNQVTISPQGTRTQPSREIKSGETVSFMATAIDTTGKPITNAVFSFSSSNAYGASWSLVAHTANTATIKFTLPTSQTTPVTTPVFARLTYGGVTLAVTGWIKVNQVIPVIGNVTIQQRSATIKSGNSFAFTVKLKDQNGKDITEFYQQYGITLKWDTSSGTNVVLNASSNKTHPSFSIRPVLQGSNTMAMVMVGIETTQNGKRVTDYVTARVIR